MRFRTSRVLLATAVVVAFLWILVVTLVIWNLDPKFGGPHRWATFVLPSYWLAAFLPSAILITLALAAEHRWRAMRSGAQSYKNLGDVLAPAIMAILISLVVTTYEGSFRVELLELHNSWRNLQFPLLITLGIFTCLLSPISTLVWIVLAVAYAALFLLGSLIIDWLTETTITPTESGTLHAIHSPNWAEPFFRCLMLASSILFVLASIQVVMHIIFWGLFLTFGRQQTRH
jgi:hypothetical protein